jgi:hypothetical protein
LQQFAATGEFICETFRHEDGVVVTLTEYESCKNYIDDVEFYSQNTHDSENPYPAESHRQE